MKRISSAVTGTALALAALFVFQLCAASGALAAMQVVVGNPGLQHFDSDGGVELDFGLTDQNGQPVGNLRPDNLQVFEDGKLAKILDFRGVGQGRPVDIVFVMDVTESMQPYIDAIKQNMVNFAHDLASNNRDYRLGLVTFEDYVVSKYPDCNCAYQKTMTSDVQPVHQLGRHAARLGWRRYSRGSARRARLRLELSVPAPGPGHHHHHYRRPAPS